MKSKTKRYDIINCLLDQKGEDTTYLEIGVRDPRDCFNRVHCATKYSVDPGVEFKSNPVDFPVTSDTFFAGLRSGKMLSPEIQFDVIFIDGLHVAEQAERDIANALDFIKQDGFIVLHDCNPPSEFFARETFEFINSPAERNWNGTVWKAFYKNRFNASTTSCCVDTDYGIGVISKQDIFNRLTENVNPFYEFKIFDKHRKKSLNLMDYQTFQDIIARHLS